jgi:hypothetical protein
MSPVRALLARFQAHLESIHAVRVAGHVEDYLVSEEHFERVRGPARVPEELLIREIDGEVEVGLYISDAVLRPLAAAQPPLRLLLGKLLPQYCIAAEGVSHWLYLHHRAEQDVSVSQLELEVQAEVDKFASCTLGLWQLGLLNLVTQLRERLFDGVRYFAHLGEEERERYRTANQLARTYAAKLEKRFVARRDREGFLRELRFAFRLAGGEKYAHLAAV